MALSFGESIKKTQMKSSVATAPTNLSTFSTDDVQPVVMEQEVVSFVRNNNYVWYNNYTDEKLSYIDKGENRVYRWDDANLKYYTVGSDYNEIEIIDGTGK